MKKQTDFWTQSDGTQIHICDMSDSLLTTTIKKLERNSDLLEMQFPLICEQFADETTQDVFNNFRDYLLEEINIEDRSPIYCKLYDDATRRGLTARHA